MNVSDLPDNERMAIRMAVCDNGGDVEGYYGEHMQIRLPSFKDMRQNLIAAIAVLGMRIVKDSEYLFPLGSDVSRAPDWQRHKRRASDDAPSYWCHARLEFIP